MFINYRLPLGLEKVEKYFKKLPGLESLEFEGLIGGNVELSETLFFLSLSCWAVW